MLDISDDAEEHTEENSAVNDAAYSNGKNDHSREGHCTEKLSSAELEEAAAASAKPDKHFTSFKEATATNSSQVQYCSCSMLLCFA